MNKRDTKIIGFEERKKNHLLKSVESFNPISALFCRKCQFNLTAFFAVTSSHENFIASWVDSTLRGVIGAWQSLLADRKLIYMQLSCMSIQLPIELSKAVSANNLVKVAEQTTQSWSFNWISTKRWLKYVDWIILHVNDAFVVIPSLTNKLILHFQVGMKYLIKSAFRKHRHCAGV